VLAGIPNQDYWSSFHNAWGDGIVVSDGLGSNSNSDVGSRAVCRSFKVAALTMLRGSLEFGPVRFHGMIKDLWEMSVECLGTQTCGATCTYAIRRPAGFIEIGSLGDGCAAVIKTNGQVTSLSEDKSDGFSNLTLGFTPRTQTSDWRTLRLRETECKAVLLCTDGVFDDISDIEGFALGFIDAHSWLSRVAASRRTHEILERWPVPKHRDDKTLVCLTRREVISD
jgi:hypothetical protein